MSEFGTGACCRLPDERDWYLPTGRWGWFLSLWWVEHCLWGILEAAVCLGLFRKPFYWWVGLWSHLDYCLARGFSADGWGQIFPKWPLLEEHTLKNIPQSIAFNVLPPQWAIVTSYFPRRTSKNCCQVQHRFLWSLCFTLGPSAHESLYVPFKNGVSISPSSMELLCTSPTGLQCQMFWGLFLPIPDPQAWGPDVGLRTLSPVGESLW